MYSEKKLTKRYKEYQSKYKRYVRIDSFPPLDKQALLSYELPKNLDSYLNEAMKYTCPFCGKIYMKRIWHKFVRHMYLHENPPKKPEHECICCGYKTNIFKRIDIHRETHGTFHNNQCTQCSCTFSSHSEYRHHVQAEHRGQWSYRCGLCPQVLVTMRELHSHHKSAHRAKKPRNIICELCGKAFSSEGLLKMHVGSNKCKLEDQPLLHCSQCNFTTKVQSYLNKHMRTVHEKLPCTICGKLVPKVRLKTHLVIFHTDNSAKPYQCKECGKGFANKCSYQDHTNIHTGEKPYQCPLCEKRFASNGNMYMHRRSHMGYKRKSAKEGK